MKRFLLLSIMAVALLSSFSAIAQTTIATMKTANATANIKVYWTGTGTVKANGTTLSVNVDASVTVSSGTVNLVTTGDVKLTEITCSGNAITSLDVSKCVDLTSLQCNDNKLSALSLGTCTKIITLNCKNNLLTSIDLSKNTVLEYLYVDVNKLPSLDISKLTKLKFLVCSDNLIKSYAISNMSALQEVTINNCSLTSLTIQNCPALKKLTCSNNKLTSIDLSAATSLTDIILRTNQLTNIKLPSSSNLTYLDCSVNLLTSIDVSKCSGLTTFFCSSNKIMNLDIRKCTKLISFSAVNQTMTLPQATAVDGTLSVDYPIYFNGSLVTDINSLGGVGVYENNLFTWYFLEGTSGEAKFNFANSTNNFGGTITQPWIASQSTPVNEHPVDELNIFTSYSGISISGLKANQYIAVYSITGTLKYKTVVTSNSAVIEVPAGVYVVKIDNQSFKVVKY